MEIIKDELLKQLSDLICDIKLASVLVENGKEVPCFHKLQGSRAKLLNLVEFVKRIPDNLTTEEKESIKEIA